MNAPATPSTSKLIAIAYLWVCIPCAAILLIVWFILWKGCNINYFISTFIGLLAAWYYHAIYIRNWIKWAHANGTEKDRILKIGRLSLVLWFRSTVEDALNNKQVTIYKPLISSVISFLLIIALVSGVKGPNFLLVKYYYLLANSRQKAKDMQGAIDYYTKVLTYDPSFTIAYISRGSAYLDIKNYDQAIADYTEAMKLSPANAEPYSYRGRVYYDLKDTAKSLQDYNKAISLDTKFAYAYYNKGLLEYTLLKNRQAGCADLKIALSLGMSEAQELMDKGGCQ